LTHVPPQQVNPIPHEGLQEPPELPLEEVVPEDPVPVDDPPPEDPLDVVPAVEASEGAVDTPPPHCSERTAKPRPARPR
jgi:hypothetical protein